MSIRFCWVALKMMFVMSMFMTFNTMADGELVVAIINHGPGKLYINLAAYSDGQNWSIVTKESMSGKITKASPGYLKFCLGRGENIIVSPLDSRINADFALEAAYKDEKEGEGKGEKRGGILRKGALDFELKSPCAGQTINVTREGKDLHMTTTIALEEHDPSIHMQDASTRTRTHTFRPAVVGDPEPDMSPDRHDGGRAL
jgi:hypothetical protein